MATLTADAIPWLRAAANIGRHARQITTPPSMKAYDATADAFSPPPSWPSDFRLLRRYCADTRALAQCERRRRHDRGRISHMHSRFFLSRSPARLASSRRHAARLPLTEVAASAHGRADGRSARTALLRLFLPMATGAPFSCFIYEWPGRAASGALLPSSTLPSSILLPLTLRLHRLYLYGSRARCNSPAYTAVEHDGRAATPGAYPSAAFQDVMGRASRLAIPRPPRLRPA